MEIHCLNIIIITSIYCVACLLEQNIGFINKEIQDNMYPINRYLSKNFIKCKIDSKGY